MEAFGWPGYAYASAWLATLTLLLLAALFRRRKLNLPPGPKPWPIIGNLNLMGPLPHQSIHHLSQRYGPLMRLRFGSFPVLVASSPAAAKLILKTHDLTFASRPRTAAGKYTAYNYSNIAWSPYDAYWRQARRMCLMELFSTKRLESFHYIRVEGQKALRDRIREAAAAGEAVKLKDHLLSGSLNVMSRMVLGENFLDAVADRSSSKGEKAAATPEEEFKRMVDELVRLNGVLNIGDFIPWLGFLDLQGYVKRMRAVARTFDGFMERLLDEREKRRKGVKDYVGQDMLDVMLEVADDPDLEVKLERDGVKAFTQDLLAGGTASSAASIEWAMSEVLKKPKVLAKATDELDRVIGRERWVEEKDFPQLPYINAIVKEVLRLHPAAPFLVPRIAREDCCLEGGYDVQKNTGVLVNVWTIGRDPSIWDKPDEFRPERFEGKDIDVMGQDFELLPFGSGRRMCPGISLGLKVIQSTTANLLHGFSWKLPGAMRPDDLNMEEIFGLATPRKVPLIVIPELRIPNLY